MEDEIHKNINDNKSLVSSIWEKSKEEKSHKEIVKTTEPIYTNADVLSKNFYNIFLLIDSTKLSELRSSLYEYSVRYSRLRVDQLLSDNEQRKIIDEERTRVHNAFIDACNILSRNMIKNSEDASWREQLSNDRKVIGDFACFINYMLSLKAS